MTDFERPEAVNRATWPVMGFTHQGAVDWMGSTRRGSKPSYLFPAGILLDEIDRIRFGVRSWKIGKRGYVIRECFVDGKRYSFKLHRVITDAPPGVVVDHINGNSLDNRRENLRLVTQQINIQNQQVFGKRSPSTVRGVHFKADHQPRPWCAEATVDGKRHFLGYFSTVDEAHNAASAFRAASMPGATEIHSQQKHRVSA